MSEKKILPVKSDIVFRMFFADERNIEFLTSFLKSVIQLPDDEYEKIDIADPFLSPEYIGDKYAIIDIKLYTKSRKILHVEIQLQITPEVKDRIVFYDAKLITEQLGSGDKYQAIQKVISIVITDDNIVKESARYHHKFTFYDSEAGVEFTDIIEIHTLELKKLPAGDDGTDLYDWAKFIAASSEEELEMVAERNPQVKKAVVTLRKLSADEQARDMYERREKAIRDIDSRERFAEQKGETAKAYAIARKMKTRGRPLFEIVEDTGLSLETIENL